MSSQAVQPECGRRDGCAARSGAQGLLYESERFGVAAAGPAAGAVRRDPGPLGVGELPVHVRLDGTTQPQMAHPVPAVEPGLPQVPQAQRLHAPVTLPVMRRFRCVEEEVARLDAERQRAFAEQVLPEVEVLLRVAMSLTAQSADAEDLVQETLLRAFRAVDRFDGRHPRAWLLTIMRNAEVNRHRRRRPRLLDDPDADLDRLATSPVTPEELVIGETFDEVVDAAFAALPFKHRQVVRLVDVDGLSYAEVAQLLGVPAGTVMSRLHRARKRIRDRLAAAGLAPKRGVL